jgi:hypothetical protein
MEIKLLEVDVDSTGRPRNDGTRGSGLYAVAIKLSARPSRDWAEAFVRHWDRPSSYSTMHRPGIASVRDDRVILNGTTIEEVEKTHAKTLKLAVDAANRDAEEIEARRRQAAERQAQEADAHEANVRDVAARISFE